MCVCVCISEFYSNVFFDAEVTEERESGERHRIKSQPTDFCFSSLVSSLQFSKETPELRKMMGNLLPMRLLWTLGLAIVWFSILYFLLAQPYVVCSLYLSASPKDRLRVFNM